MVFQVEDEDFVKVLFINIYQVVRLGIVIDIFNFNCYEVGISNVCLRDIIDVQYFGELFCLGVGWIGEDVICFYKLLVVVVGQFYFVV